MRLNNAMQVIISAKFGITKRFIGGIPYII